MIEITDASVFRGCADEIFSPRDEDELLRVLTRGVPATILGALTGVTGAAVPQSGSAISTAKLNRVEIFPGRAVVGPGALLREVQAAAARSGQFYAPDPTENTSSIGGIIAANASGSRSFRFGATREHVLALRVALMDGQVIEVRRGERVDFEVPAIRLPRTTKHSAGYRLSPGMELVDLFVGSEGTLGVVTQAELKLLPATEELTGGVVFFRSEEAALDAVERWRGIPELRMLEYLDAASLTMMRVAQAAALMIEFEGDCDLDMSGAMEERILVCDFGGGSGSLSRVPSRAAGAGERPDPAQRVHEIEHRLRGADREKSRDAGDLPAHHRHGSRDFRAHRGRASARQYVFIEPKRIRESQGDDDGSGSRGGRAGRNGGRGARAGKTKGGAAGGAIFGCRNRGDARGETAVRSGVAAGTRDAVRVWYDVSGCAVFYSHWRFLQARCNALPRAR